MTPKAVPGFRGVGGVLIHSFAKAHQAEVPERLDRPAFHKAISGAARPGFEPCEWEFHSPAEVADQRGKAAFVHAPQSGFGAKMVDQNDLASWFDHAGELIKGGLGSGTAVITNCATTTSKNAS